MPEEAITNELLKVDGRGHVLVRKERREALLDEYERCGVSAAEFAAQIGVKYQTFAHWLQKRKKARSEAVSGMPAALMVPESGKRPQWMEAVVESGSKEGLVLRVALPGGASVDVVSSVQIKLAAELLKALGNGGVC
ncbi:MAG: IS66 family insertion sequence element accessory protein TnpB [Chthoniobacteraceae bacterium]